MNNIAIIPARSGSKGLKNKNIKLLNGKPLLAYTIEAAIESKCFDVIFVSTDSREYAKIAIQYGAEVPFLRNKKNAKDKSSSWDVVKETLNNYHCLGKDFNTFMLLQPTSPLRTSKDIKNAYKLLDKMQANSIVSICESDAAPETLYKLNNNLFLSNIFENNNCNKRRQDMNKYYRFNGAIYLSKVDTFIKNNSIYSKGCYGYLMKKNNSIDIDDSIDFRFAETLIKDNK